jgi:hypothetical protein
VERYQLGMNIKIKIYLRSKRAAALNEGSDKNLNLATVDGLIAIYCFLTGISILDFWISLSARRQLFASRFPQKSIEVKYHVVAEVVTAIFLVLAGLGLLFDYQWARIITPLSLGMLLYAELNGPGFYASQGNRQMVAVFYVIACLTVIAIVGYLFLG